MIKTILVPVDSSEHARKAVKMAGEIGSKFAAKIILLNVPFYDFRYSIEGNYVAFPPKDGLIEHANKLLDEEAALLAKYPQISVEKKVIIGDPALQILECADNENCDMIIMGSKGLTGVKRFVIGSVSAKVVQYASCPVLVVKGDIE